ncbi:MAG: hypothetical protein AMXMBFR84_36450 [Candidatus Hydrogenedentota bacterium]
MNRFTDQRIIVTGASEGIGRALCLALAPQKPRLVLAARNTDRLQEVANQCQSLGARTETVPTDVCEETACKNLIDRSVAAFGGVDALVNNAGATMWARLEEMESLEIFERLMRVNYLSAVYCTYYALPHLRRSKGLVVGVASGAGLTGVPTRTGYAASKHAMFGFFDSLRIELDGTGVDVTMVAPDFVLSEIHKRAIGKDGSPLGRSPLLQNKIMTAETCAALIVKAMERRQRLLMTSSRIRLGRWVRLIAPKLIDRMALNAISKGK